MIKFAFSYIYKIPVERYENKYIKSFLLFWVLMISTIAASAQKYKAL